MENAEDMWRRIHSESMQDLDDLRKKLAACQARCETYKMILKYHGLATLDDEDAGHTED